MLIIGCDYHPGFQQIAFVDTETGELNERRLGHREQAEQFYRELKQQNLAVRVGMESSGHSRWFERLLHELGFQLWIGDPAEIRTKRVRKQKTDRQDAQLILQLVLENRFPRIWVPAAQEGGVAAGRSQGTGIHRTGALGQPTKAGPARPTRPTDTEDPGTDACAGRGSGEASGDTAADDASRSRSTDGTGL